MTIRDHEFCGDKGTLGAVCFHTLTEQKRSIEKEAWDDFRFGQVCETTSVFADWKKTIEEQCSINDNCDYPDVKSILNFFKRVETFDREAKDAKASLQRSLR